MPSFVILIAVTAPFVTSAVATLVDVAVVPSGRVPSTVTTGKVAAEYPEPTFVTGTVAASGRPISIVCSAPTPFTTTNSWPALVVPPIATPAPFSRSACVRILSPVKGGTLRAMVSEDGLTVTESESALALPAASIARAVRMRAVPASQTDAGAHVQVKSDRTRVLPMTTLPSRILTTLASSATPENAGRPAVSSATTSVGATGFVVSTVTSWVTGVPVLPSFVATTEMIYAPSCSPTFSAGSVAFHSPVRTLTNSKLSIVTPVRAALPVVVGFQS